MKKLMMIVLLISNLSFAEDVKKADPNKGLRKKDISFEERVIEGLSGKNYDSLSQTGKVEGDNKDRLYRKRGDFDDESKHLMREMEYIK